VCSLKIGGGSVERHAIELGRPASCSRDKEDESRNREALWAAVGPIAITKRSTKLYLRAFG
jgi:hypothetical protein